jgi:Alpha-L-fucosidase/F5/8 type C domain
MLPILVLAARALAADAPTWLRPPQFAVMTGFIKDPPSKQTILEWQKGLGSEFDAPAWVRGFTDAGAGYLILYDKWIDGLVFHDTRTTSYKTKRDFLREIAEACHAQKLPLVIYWNAAYDDNPEFAQWAALDGAGNPIRFPEPWPCRLLSMHSPFRQKAQEQVREILSGYGPIAGLWLDCFSQPWPTTDRYTTAAFEAHYHKAPAQAPGLAGEFVLDTLADYVRDLRRIATPLQPDLALTYNGSQTMPMASPRYAARLTALMDFVSVEGHSLAAMDSQAMAASFLSRPMETGDLISASWFSPPPPMAVGRARQALSEAAAAWCQGANVYVALSPTHEGTFGEEMATLRMLGDWLRPRQKLLAESTPWHDIGVVLGAPSQDLPGFPSLSQVWGMPVTEDAGAWAEVQALCRTIADLGYGTETLYALGDLAAWPRDLSPFHAMVLPERACLDESHAALLREYVRGGGRLLAFGHASLLDADGKARNDFALADVLGLRYEGPAKFPPEAGPSLCYADSEYGNGWIAPNLADGTAAGWASADSPMPHWAQVNLPVEQPVARVRVVGREGEYVLRDLEVLTWNGAGWDLVRRYENNEARIVDCPIDPPRETLGVRVVVHAEAFQGNDRRLADIEEIEVYGPDGRRLSGTEPYPIEVLSDSSGLPAGRLAAIVHGPAVIARPEGDTEVAATFADPTDGAPRPLLTTHAFDRGAAYWLAAGETSVPRDAAWWKPVLERAGQRATVAWEPVGRHRVILRRADGALLVCAIDTRPDLPPAELTLIVSAPSRGLQGAADPWADGDAVRGRRVEGGTEFSLTPDPVATVLVR